MLLAFATVLGPLGVGFLVGGARPWAAAAAVLALVGAGVLWVGSVGTADWWWMAAWLGVGAVAAQVLEDGRALAGSLLGAVLGLAVLEGGARLLLPAPGYLPPAEEARWTISERGFAEGMEPRCARVLRDPDGPAVRPVVLHLGDSLVYGEGAQPEDPSFPQVLDRLDPRRTHWNEGEPMRSVDCELLVLLRWATLAEDVDAVVLYLFAGNDAVGMDEPLVTCGDQPVLRYPEGGGVEPTCLEPTLPVPVRARPFLSPAPYALRRLSGASRAVAELTLRYYDLLRRRRPGLGRDAEEGREPTAADLDHLGRAIAAMRDHLDARGIPLAVALLPDRRGLVPGAFAASHAVTVAGLREAVDAAGLPWLDATPAFAAWVAGDDAGRWFAPGAYVDPHLSVDGHAALAGWLAPRLPGLLGEARDAHAARTGNRVGDAPVDPR